MSASLQLPGGLLTLNPQPEISRYYNLAETPYTNIAQVIFEVVFAARYIGQTFLVGTEEYWFNPTTVDGDLVKKSIANVITGSGTPFRIPLFTSSNTIGDSVFSQTNSSSFQMPWINGGATTAAMGFFPAVGNPDHFTMWIQTGESFLMSGTRNLTLGTVAATDIKFRTTNLERARITSGGNFLIGTTTDNSPYKLQVSGSGSFTTGLKYGKGIDVTSTNLDTLLEAGFYWGSLFTNSPTTGYYWITVEGYSSTNWVHQTATSLGASNTPNRVYTRVRNNGFWTPWVEMIKSDTLLNINGNSYDLTTNREWRVGQGDTGCLISGGLSVNSGTTINIGVVSGYIIDNESTPQNPSFIAINYPGATNVAVTTIGSGTAGYVMLGAGNVITFQTSFPTSVERKAKIWIGKVAHPLGTITAVINEPDYITSPQSFSRDLFQVIGPYINQNVYAYPNAANLTFNLTGGKIYGNGINFVTSRTDPNALSFGPFVPTTFLYRTQTGGATGGVTNISPGFYDVGGVITPVGGGANESTIQYIFAIPGQGVIVQYGQFTYNNLATAIATVSRENFTVFPNLIQNSILIGVLCLIRTATNLSNPAQAQFFKADRFGQIIGATAGTSVGTLQITYNNSLYPQIAVTDANQAFALKNSRALDTSNVFEIKNIASTTTASINGNGDLLVKTLNIEYNASGSGIYINNYSSGNGIRVNNNSTGIGEIINNSSSGIGVSIVNSSTGRGIVLNGTTPSTGFLYTGQNNGIDTFTINKSGNVTANSFIKSGATNQDILLGDGTTASYATVVTGGQTGFFTWKYSTVITPADPGNGFFRSNNATSSLVTQLYVNDITSSNQVDISDIFAAIGGKWLIHIQQRNDASKWAQYNTNSSYIDNGGWWTINVVYVQSGSGGPILNGVECLFVLINKNGASNSVVGTGTTNFLSKFNTASTIVNSQIFDNGSNVSIGTAIDNGHKLQVSGSINGDSYNATPLYTYAGGEYAAGTFNTNLYNVFTDVNSFIPLFTGGTIIVGQGYITNLALGIQRDTDNTNGDGVLQLTGDGFGGIAQVWRFNRGGDFKTNGLNYTKAIDASGVNLDFLLDAGFYYGNSLINAPTAGDYYITIERVSFNDSYAHQTATSVGISNTGNRIYTRCRVAGIWTSWIELATSAGTISGSGSNQQVAYWNGASTVTGNNDFLWDNTSKTLKTRIIFQRNDLGANLNFIGSEFDALAGGASKVNVAHYVYSGSYNIYTSGGKRFTVLPNGNVGIRTNNPATDFHVQGEILTTASNYAATITGKLISFRCDGTGNIIQAADNGGNSPDTLLINPFGGNVGIGTSNPTQKLNIASATNTTLTKFDNTSGSAYIGVDSTRLALQQMAGGSIDMLNSVGLLLATLLPNGNLGIGTTTPSAKLTVNNLVGGNPTYFGDIQINQLTVPQNTNTNGGLEFRLDNSASGWGKRIIGAFDGFGGYDLHFQERNNNPLWNTNFIIKSNGNVGIGTTNPLSKFVVSASGIGIETDPANGDFFAFNRNTSQYAPLNIQASLITFRAGATERMRIIDNGAVLINRTVDAGSGYKLQIDGNSLFNGIMSINGGTGYGISATSTGSFAVLAMTDSIGNPALIVQNNGGGDLAQFNQAFGFTVAKVDYNGRVTSQGFIKEGGTSSEFLMADGSVSLGSSIPSGIYTPTFTTITGSFSAFSNIRSTYYKVGNIVTANIAMGVTVPATTGLYQFTLTLPFTRATGNPYPMGTASNVLGLHSFSTTAWSNSTSTVMVDFNKTSGAVQNLLISVLISYDVTY